MARILDLWLQGYLQARRRKAPSMALTSDIFQRLVRSGSHGWCHYVALAEESPCLDIAVKNHKHAVNNPYTQFWDGWTEEQVLNPPKVSDLITTLLHTPNSVRRPIQFFYCARKH